MGPAQLAKLLHHFRRIEFTSLKAGFKKLASTALFEFRRSTRIEIDATVRVLFDENLSSETEYESHPAVITFHH
jgi:hypothetical protein